MQHITQILQQHRNHRSRQFSDVPAIVGNTPAPDPVTQLTSGIEDDLNILVHDPKRKKEVEHKLYLRYLGALVSVVGIKNKQGVLSGYREGYTRGKLEVMARAHAKRAVRTKDPRAMVAMLRQDMERDPAFARAMMAGYPRPEKKQEAQAHERAYLPSPEPAPHPEGPELLLPEAGV